MLWVVVAAAILVGLAIFGVFAVRSARKLNRQISDTARAVQEAAERENRYEFYKWALDRQGFMLLYADMPEVIEREVGPENWHSLLCHWGMPPTNPTLWVDPHADEA